MPILAKTSTGLWKATVKKSGYRTVVCLFPTKAEAAQWVEVTKDEMARGVFVPDKKSASLKLEEAMRRYLAEVTPGKSLSSQALDIKRSEPIIEFFGKLSLAEITPDLVTQYQVMRANRQGQENGEHFHPRSQNSLQLELRMLQHLFTLAVKEWGVTLDYNPVFKVRLELK